MDFLDSVKELYDSMGQDTAPCLEYCKFAPNIDDTALEHDLNDFAEKEEPAEVICIAKAKSTAGLIASLFGNTANNFLFTEQTLYIGRHGFKFDEISSITYQEETTSSLFGKQKQKNYLVVDKKSGENEKFGGGIAAESLARLLDGIVKKHNENPPAEKPQKEFPRSKMIADTLRGSDFPGFKITPKLDERRINSLIIHCGMSELKSSFAASYEKKLYFTNDNLYVLNNGFFSAGEVKQIPYCQLKRAAYAEDKKWDNAEERFITEKKISLLDKSEAVIFENADEIAQKEVADFFNTIISDATGVEIKTEVEGAEKKYPNDVSELFGGNGTGKKKELFDKLLETWNDVFKMDDFFVNPVYEEMQETIKLPVDEQLHFMNKNWDYLHPNMAWNDVHKAEENAERRIARVQSAKDKIDFVCLNRLWHMFFFPGVYKDGSPYISVSATESNRSFYYFRYKKQDNTLEFKYQPYIRNNSKSVPQECAADILELSFLSGSQSLRASVYWQPEVTFEQTESDPQSFFNKIGRSDVYENLKTFVEKLNAPIEEKKKAEEEEKKAEQKRQQEAKEAQVRGEIEKKRQKRRLGEKKDWKERTDVLIAKREAESALDTFLDSGAGSKTNKDRRKELAAEYLQKGRTSKEEGNEKMAFTAFGMANELGNVDAKCELGICYLDGLGAEKDEIEAFELFNDAASFEHAVAQFMLGSCYENGRGTEKNEEKAISWYEKSARQGNEQAIVWLREHGRS